ncbi:amidase family protein [Streptomyces sp. NPDC058686]|uniref:amidase family protein n=1 Tax=Streptomyces sp. NPDC058686 TaxID=3346599 RepID=UPI0036568DBD
MPTGPAPAVRTGRCSASKYPYLDQLVWAGLPTMPGLPATAIPAGRSPEGLPVGVQLIGPMFEDRTPLRLAELLEQKIGGFQRPE